MASISEILVVFTGSSGGLIASAEEAKTAIKGVGDESTKTSSVIAQIGKVAVVAAAAGVVAFSATSIKAASDFQKQLTMVTTQANQQGANLTQIGNSLLAMAPQLGVSATDLATIYYHFASAGMSVSASLDATRQAAELAKVGNSDYEDTAQAVVAVLSAYPQYAGNATSAVATLNAIVGTGDMRMQQLAAAMSTGILPAFATAKLTITDAGAALATITDNATPANEAATRLRMTVALLQHQSGPAADALGTIGIKSGQLGEDMTKPDGLLNAVTDLKDHLTKAFGPQAMDQANQYVSILQNQGVDAANKYADSVHGAANVIQTAFGGGKTSAAIETLLGEYDKFKSKYPAIVDGAANFQNAWETTKNTFSFQMDAMKAGLDSLSIHFGQALLPMASAAMGWLTSNVMPKLQQFADWFVADGIPQLQRFGNFLGTQVPPMVRMLTDAFNDTLLPMLRVMVAVLGFAVDHWGFFKFVLLAIVAPLVAVKAAMFVQNEVKAAVGAFNTWLDAAKKVSSAIMGLPGAIASIPGRVSSMAETVYLKFLYLKDGVGKTVSAVVEFGEKAWLTAQAWATAIASTIADFARAAVAAGVNAVKTAASWVAAAAQTALEWGKAAISAVRDFAVMAAQASANAVKVGTAWLLEKGAFLAGQAVKLAVWLATNAVMLATAVATGVAAAAAFLLPLAPIILIGVAVIALVALIVTHWTQIRSFMATVWNGIKNDAAAAWSFLWDHIIKPVINFIIAGINSLVGGINAFLGVGESVLSHIPGLGGLQGKTIPTIPSLQFGGSVNATGLYQLHAGEHVLNPQQTAAMRSGSTAVPSIGAVNVYNPASGVDVITAVQQQQWLARMAQRGVRQPGAWPMNLAAG